jgi:hypothetical protein
MSPLQLFVANGIPHFLCGMRNGERDTSILIPIFIIIYNGVNSAGTICFDERYM